mmetsp:Transcript_4554/g.11698  ORF Transcript_4554/g.11698 Transcript_4554/m.11698 type:complete len:202 (+) Transcript_4554:331-936(+)
MGVRQRGHFPGGLGDVHLSSLWADPTVRARGSRPGPAGADDVTVAPDVPGQQPHLSVHTEDGVRPRRYAGPTRCAWVLVGWSHRLAMRFQRDASRQYDGAHGLYKLRPRRRGVRILGLGLFFPSVRRRGVHRYQCRDLRIRYFVANLRHEPRSAGRRPDSASSRCPPLGAKGVSDGRRDIEIGVFESGTTGHRYLPCVCAW